jgi:hypothetical protein
LTACGVKPQSSGIDAVHIEQTPIENQFSIGFCWSYATIGLIESNYKAKTGKTINLSEEALGYQRMKNEMLEIAKQFRTDNLTIEKAMDRITGNSLESWIVRAADDETSRDAMELVDDYGLVPESEWSVKFDSPRSVAAMKQAIRQPFRALLTSEEPISSEAMDRVLTSDQAFPSTPPALIPINGKKITTRDFARNVIGFSSSEYMTLRAKTAADALSLVQLVKKALAAGFSVPMSFGVSYANLKEGHFQAPNYAVKDLDTDPRLSDAMIDIKGGHAVLITDFVNVGGVEGAVSPEKLTKEINQPAEELAFLKFKNSWGAGKNTNESGIGVNSSADGYYRMDLGYIKAVSAKGRFGIVIPRSIMK